MRSRREFLLSAAASAVCSPRVFGQVTRPAGGQHLNPVALESLRLEVVPTGQTGSAFFPEQSPSFDLFLRNTGSESVSVLELDGDFTTPVFTFYDGGGKEIGHYTNANLMARGGADLGSKAPPQAEMHSIPPGKADKSKLNAWSFVRPFPPGRYAVQVSHNLGTGSVITSERLRFEITKARVASAASGYNNPTRSASVLAWLASAHSAEEVLRLLVRLSTPKGYEFLQAGGTSHGDFPAGSQVAVAEMAPDVRQGVLGWLAVASPHQAVLIRHNLTYPYWRSAVIPLPLEHPLPVPRFPDMGQDAMFLATGASGNGGELVGVAVNQPKGVTAQWSVPLRAVPSMTACCLRLQRVLSVLLVVNRQSGSEISRIDVTLDGKIVSPEKILRTSPDTVIAIAPGIDPSLGSFLAMEAHPGRPNRYALVRIPLSGRAQVGNMQEFRAWPVDTAGTPVSPRFFFLEEFTEKFAGFAFAGPNGEFGTGRLEPRASVSQLRGASESASLFPHIAVLKSGATPACFTADGRLFIAGEPFAESQ